jgi:hypothetical protein
VGPAFIHQTRHPEDFFHHSGFVGEKVAYELRQAADRAIPTSPPALEESLMRVTQHI